MFIVRIHFTNVVVIIIHRSGRAHSEEIPKIHRREDMGSMAGERAVVSSFN
jgi:hypothetical protein